MVAEERKQIDLKALRATYQERPAGKAALDHFASRQKSSRKTTVERLQALLRQEGYEVDRGEIIDLFRRLEAANCGRFLIGRKGHLSRFEWSVSLVSVGQAASGEVNKVEELSANDEIEVEDEAIGDVLDHRFMLRPEFEVRLSLPKDLSSSEATRLADFIKTLPFGT